jgi:hypothetical protein
MGNCSYLLAVLQTQLTVAVVIGIATVLPSRSITQLSPDGDGATETRFMSPLSGLLCSLTVCRAMARRTE